MLIPNERYEFTPRDDDPRRPIVVLGLREYARGQTRNVDVWRLEMPARYSAIFTGHVEFESLSAVLAALATQFCDGDEAETRQRLLATKVG